MQEPLAVANASEQLEIKKELVPLHGLPDSVFRITQRPVDVIGNSGKSKLRVEITKSRIYIFDVERTSYFFDAKVEAGVLSFSIINVAKEPGFGLQESDQAAKKLMQHPDIYPKDWAKRALQFFTDQGTVVNQLRLNWVNDSSVGTNYRQYHEHKQKLGGASDQQVAEAVFSTWSGKLAQELGFEEIVPQDDGFIVDQDGWVSVLLRKTKNIQFEFEEKKNKDVQPVLEEK